MAMLTPTNRELYPMALNYLIGVEDDVPIVQPDFGTVNVIPYDRGRLSTDSNAIAYGNLFDELCTGRYGPYMEQTEIAKVYNELAPHEDGPGFMANVRDQVEERLRQGYVFMELDNAEAFSLAAINRALEYCHLRKVGVLAKNAFNLCEEQNERVGGAGVAYLANANICGCIVELDSGTPVHYNALRNAAQKPNLPIWFVGFGGGEAWYELKHTADMICTFRYHNMSVSWSQGGRYKTSKQILLPDKFKLEPGNDD